MLKNPNKRNSKIVKQTHSLFSLTSKTKIVNLLIRILLIALRVQWNDLIKLDLLSFSYYNFIFYILTYS